MKALLGIAAVLAIATVANAREREDYPYKDGLYKCSHTFKTVVCHETGDNANTQYCYEQVRCQNFTGAFGEYQGEGDKGGEGGARRER